MRIWWVALAVVAAAGNAQAGSREVQYGPPPAWLAPPPSPTSTAPIEGAPVRMIYSDTQTRLGVDHDEIYSAYRVKLLTPQALALGNLTGVWNPSSDDLIVHRLQIHRGGQTIDVLASNKFQIIQREDRLESAVLDGQLTAVLQTPGLQVGDELEFAATIRRRDPTLGPRSEGFLQLPVAGAPGAFRVILSWPDSKPVQWRASPDLGAAPMASQDGLHRLTYELDDPKSAIVADGAPPIYNVHRLVQYSSFSDWGEVSRLLKPLFDQAAALAPDSPLHEEGRKIAASTSDPAARAEAALKLVQEQVRYVYVGLNGGNYRPAAADETWTRRFGDCKAKTVLLIGLLRELGIAAEPVLVNSTGDGTDQRLPMLEVFDHVLVRATIGGKNYWLDGTRTGDRHLALLPQPVFRWALPLRAAGARLEPVEAEPPALPQSIDVVKLDASAGFDKPARIEQQNVIRGDDAYALRTQLAGLSPEDADRALKSFWRNQWSIVEPETTAWRYEEAQRMLVLSMTGTGKPDWEGDDKSGRSLDIMGAGFTPPDEHKRPKEQDQTAPWTTNFPRFRCWVTYIRLPPETSRWQWAYAAKPMNLKLGGVFYWRQAELKDGVMRTVMSSRTYLRELTPVQAQEINDQLPSFDNKISRVYQSREAVGPLEVPGSHGPATAKPIDWTQPDTPCLGPNSAVKLGGY